MKRLLHAVATIMGAARGRGLEGVGKTVKFAAVALATYVCLATAGVARGSEGRSAVAVVRASTSAESFCADLQNGISAQGFRFSGWLCKPGPNIRGHRTILAWVKLTRFDGKAHLELIWLAETQPVLDAQVIDAAHCSSLRLRAEQRAAGFSDRKRPGTSRKWTRRDRSLRIQARRSLSPRPTRRGVNASAMRRHRSLRRGATVEACVVLAASSGALRALLNPAVTVRVCESWRSDVQPGLRVRSPRGADRCCLLRREAGQFPRQRSV